ncbi:uncharacterized protein LOC110055446 [Orbicella faveolata]|uniref:uncharacterized protein LOC110055446 n=1 Tax=Orbicella faveolata TaxID=48498 RepID=UPI0009E4BF3F|nr:uncharacterized protein LOC110055446 [Orbicella faveolata]
MKTFAAVLVAFYAAVYGGFSVETERIGETVQDQSKLNFSAEQILNFRSLVAQVDILQKKTKDLIMPKLPQNVTITVLDSLDLSADITVSTVNRTTDAGVLVDDMERFIRFEAAVDLVTNTSCDVKVQDASRKLSRVLWSLISLMRSVMRKNSIAQPPQQDLSGLRGKLDKKTKEFLTFIGAGDKQIMVNGQVRRSVLNNVRNYVIMRDLSESLLFFKIDFGKLIN